MPQILACGLCLFFFVTPAADAQDEMSEAQIRQFVERSVRPLLETRCYECHGPGVAEPKGSLRVDSQAALLAGGDSGPAVVPGKPAESLLIEAIRYEGFEMPPRSRMPDGEVEILTKWVRLGAPLPATGPAGTAHKAAEFPLEDRIRQHWAWAPISNAEPPEVRDGDWPLGDIDRHVLAKLEAAELHPAPRADRRTLLRRLYFDLTGLPPSREDLAKFLGDERDDAKAIADVVDRLLASEHFGERWGRHWLDLVRYAETLGHEFDYPLHYAHEYRDYVIRALNADVPYDQFVTEHLAGDLLERPRLHPTEGFNESLIGTGFWYLGEAKHAPVDVRGEEAAMIDNRIDVFSKTFLGLTVACARCHDHKFDAITTRDYYALAGVLQSSRRNIGMLDPGGKIAADRRQLARLRAEGDQLVADSVREAIGELQADEVRDWARSSATAITSPENPLYLLAATGVSSPSAFETQLRTAVARVEAEQARSDQARTHLVPFANFRGGLPEGWSSTGEAFGSDCVTSGLEWDWNREPVSRLPAGQAHSGALSGRLRGILRSPTFELRHKQVLYSVRGDGVQLRIIIDGYRMNDFSELLFKGANLNVKTGGETKWLRHAADVSRYVGHRCHLEIVDNGDGWGAIDEIAFSNGGPDPSGPPAAASIALAAGQPATFDELLAATLRMAAQGIDQSADQASVELCNAMLRHGLLQPRQQLPRLAKLRQQMAEIEARLPAPRLVIAMTDGTPENEHVFIRGSHKNLGEPVPRRLLTAFGSPEIPDEAGSGRLLIAQQMFDGRNPFPARVMANRVWHHLFGRGIVDSPDNFGVLGKRPTNPQLLDHLAGSLRDDGWSLKRLIRRIVLSQTYQMASRSPAEAERTDPSNLMLHRASIRRLQAEAIRDSMLAISGRLDERVFGPSIPVYLTPFMQGRGRPKSGPLDGAGRRSIYTRLNRNFLPPMMLAFDMPIPFTTIGRRSVSNVPAQALILLNDPFVAQQARLWSQRLLRETADPKERLQAMYEEAFARPPVDAEVSRAVTFLKSRGGNQWQTHAEAWSDLCHVMMNTKEFIFLN